MGTRNLTMVISGGKPRVAQYGQWDGYPEGQGASILAFLHKYKDQLTAFKEKVETLRFATDEDEKEIEEFMKSIGCPDGYMNMEQSEKYQEKYGWLSRDRGSDILHIIMEGKFTSKNWSSGKIEIECGMPRFLSDNSNFAADSLFCEWAYVIDLDKGTFEAYKGFNKKPLGKTQRFRYLQDSELHLDKNPDGGVISSKYYPVRLKKKFKLSELPTEREFVDSFKTKKELAEEAKP